MKRKIFIALVMLLAVSLAGVVYSPAAMAADGDPGAVYTMTNDAAGNQVVIFNRDAGGMLTPAGSVATQGLGSGPGPGAATGGLDPLGSQGSLVLSPDGKWLFACNAGSNDITVCSVSSCGLTVVSRISSGGVMPTSICVAGNNIFCLNAGGACPNISCFNLSSSGQLTAISNSTVNLGAGNFGQLACNAAGTLFACTDKANNRILIFQSGAGGLPGQTPVVSASSGNTPFGCIFDQQNRLLCVEAGANAVSTYNIGANGALTPISKSVANCQKAACWIASNNRGFCFTANPGTSSISCYRMNADGSVTLVSGVAGSVKSAIDIACSPDGQFLYACDPGNGGIDIFRIDASGNLTNMGTAAAGLGIFGQGMAVR